MTNKKKYNKKLIQVSMTVQISFYKCNKDKIADTVSNVCTQKIKNCLQLIIFLHCYSWRHRRRLT